MLLSLPPRASSIEAQEIGSLHRGQSRRSPAIDRRGVRDGRVRGRVSLLHTREARLAVALGIGLLIGTDGSGAVTNRAPGLPAYSRIERLRAGAACGERVSGAGRTVLVGRRRSRLTERSTAATVVPGSLEPPSPTQSSRGEGNRNTVTRNAADAVSATLRAGSGSPRLCPASPLRT